MALKFIEGFDYFGSTTDFLGKWGSSGTADISFDTGRFGVGTGKCIRLQRIASQPNCYYNLAAAVTELVIGFGFRTTSLSNGDRTILYLANQSLGINAALGYDTSGHLQAFRGTTTGTVLGTTTATILADTWYYIEQKWKIADSGGYVIVKIDGVEVLNVTGLDTKALSSANIDQLLFFGMNSGTGSKYFDDMYMCDLTGTVNNDFLGECRVKYIKPTGDGPLQEWDPSAGAAWECVDETTPDGDTTYVLSDSAGDIALYDVEGISVDDVIKGVDVVVMARKDDAPTRIVKPTIRVEGFDHDGATKTLTTSYAYSTHIWETNPETLAAWTPAEITDLQVGMTLDT